MPQLTENLQQRLRQMLERDSKAILNTPKKLESALKEHCPQNEPEIKLLLTALAQGVPEKLMRAAPGVPPEVTYAKLTNGLQHNLFLNQETARWAVDSWAVALGLPAAAIHPAPAMDQPQTASPTGAAQPHDSLKDVHIEIKIDRDGKAVPYIPGHEPSRYKVEFHGDRIGGLLLTAFVLYQGLRILSADTLQALFDVSQDHTGYFWLVVLVVTLLSLFSVRKRFD